MSNYFKLTKHPKTGEWENAQWIDDFFGKHEYAVLFKDGSYWKPDKIETKD